MNFEHPFHVAKNQRLIHGIIWWNQVDRPIEFLSLICEICSWIGLCIHPLSHPYHAINLIFLKSQDNNFLDYSIFNVSLFTIT